MTDPFGYAAFKDPDADAVEVEVWDYSAQDFIESYRCTGERRVRVDYHGDLSDLAVFEVKRQGPEFIILDGNKPLKDWRIDLT